MVGVLMVLFSATLPPPIAVAWWYDGMSVVMPFAETLAATLGLGLLCWLPVCRFKVDLRNRDGFVVVVAFWVLAVAAGRDTVHAGRTSAHAGGGCGVRNRFRSDHHRRHHPVRPRRPPKAILYYRAQLNLLGGMGWWCWRWRCCRCWASGDAALKAETPGPMKDEKLTPRITETAKNLWVIYFGLNVACALSFWLAGMSPFDAVCHSFPPWRWAVFPPRRQHRLFQQRPIELISGVFTLIAAVNFALYFMAWRRRSLWLVFQDAEFQFFLVVIGGIVALTCAYLYFSGTFPLVDLAGTRVFQSLSIVTSNGHTSAGYSADWPFSFPCCSITGQLFRWLRRLDLRRHQGGSLPAAVQTERARNPAADPSHRADRGQTG